MCNARRFVVVCWMFLLAPGVQAQQVDTGGAQPAAEQFGMMPPYRERIARSRPVAELSVRDVVEQTIRANLDLVLERYNRLLTRVRVVATEGFYDPTIGLSSTFGENTSPQTAAPGDRRVPGETVRTSAFGPTLRQNLVGGGSLAASVTTNVSETSSLTPTVNPSYSSVFSASMTQPLLRGLVRTAIDRQVKNGRIDVDIS